MKNVHMLCMGEIRIIMTPDSRNVDPVKSINQYEQYDPMVFWVDIIGKLGHIPFIDNQDIFFP